VLKSYCLISRQKSITVAYGVFSPGGLSDASAGGGQNHVMGFANSLTPPGVWSESSPMRDFSVYLVNEEGARKGCQDRRENTNTECYMGKVMQLKVSLHCGVRKASSRLPWVQKKPGGFDCTDHLTMMLTRRSGSPWSHTL
jgi:hypothetical protein